MTIEQLKHLIGEAAWFQWLGESDLNDDYQQITTLGPWADKPTGDERLERIADQMDWLPSSSE